MNRTLSLTLLFAAATSPLTAQKAAQRGALAFDTAFQRNATGRSDINAYLLAHLNVAIYPEFLDQIAPENLNERTLHKDPARFTAAYRKYTGHLFPPGTEFQFFSAPLRGDGYDPEAMVIGTPDLVLVVFRGTDRVAGARSDTGYQWNEWIKSDFNFVGVAPGDGMRGKVHAGFWNSLAVIKNQVAEKVVALGGRTRKTWITGHSLGAAHAQLFAAYLKSKHQVTAQGVYAFAAPHVGNQEFVAELDGMFPDPRLQRFEFVDDPITMLPGYVMGYQRAGVRCYYHDLDSYQFNAQERSVAEEARLLPALVGTALSALGDAVNKDKQFKLDFAGGAFCFHYPAWYAAAAYHQLTSGEKAKCPAPIGLPLQTAEGCGLAEIARARSSEPLDQVRTVVKEVVEYVEYNVSNLIANANGSAIPAGTYYIRCNAGGRYLDTDGDVTKNGAAVNLSGLGDTRRDNKFTIKRDGAVGYTIAQGGAYLEVDANGLFSNNTKVQMWEANAFGGHLPNQKWLFFRIKGDRYLLLNLGSLKALDANDNTVTSKNGRVKQYTPLSNDQTQVWILSKA